MAYVLKYSIYYKSRTGKDGVVKFYKKNYTGSDTELVGTAEPVIGSFKGKDDEAENPIKCKSWTITIFDAEVGTYDEFFTSDSKTFQVIITEDGTNVMLGWVDVDDYTRPLFTYAEDFIIKANDGLAGLKNEAWRDIDGSNFSDYVTLKDAVCACLFWTGLTSNLYESADLYEAGMDETDADSPLTQAKFKADVFRKSDGTFESCYKVLEEILGRFQCEVYQCMFNWQITRINNRVDTFVRRLYTYSSGAFTYSSNAEYDPTVEIDGTTHWLWDMPMISSRPAWKKFVIKQDYGFESNLAKVRSSDLNEFAMDWQFLPLEDKLKKFGAFGGLIYSVYNDGSIRLYHTYTFNSNRYLQVVFWVEDNTDQQLKIDLSFSGNVPVRIRCYLQGSSFWNLDSNGEWFENESEKNIFYTNANAGFETIKVANLPENGFFILRFYQPFAPSRNRYDDFIIKPEDIKVTIESKIGFDESYIETTLINENHYYVPDDLELKLGDIPNISNANAIYKGGLYLDDGITHTSSWHTKDNPTVEKSLNALLADEISSNHVYSSGIINCSIYGDLEVGNTIIIDGMIFIITMVLNHNRYESEMNCDLFQIGVTEEKQAFLKLKAGGYLKLKAGGKIKLRTK